MRRIILACTGVLTCCCLAAVAGSAQAVAVGETQEAKRQAAVVWLGNQVYAYQQATRRWEQLMGAPPTPTEGRVLAQMSIPDVRSAVDLWKRRAAAARRLAAKPPHLSAWRCIHRFEGGWSSNTGNGYYGGLQMNLGFQRTYGRRLFHMKGTADHWTPLEQMWAAEKAAKSRGFWPWPNTARYCGLI